MGRGGGRGGRGGAVLDLCAAPGGKATAMATGGADVIAADLQLHRAQLIRGVPVVVGDAAAAAVSPSDRSTRC